MKKQINPTIKAHLVRGAFYVVLLLAVCVIPFALAQRNAIKQRSVVPKGQATKGQVAATKAQLAAQLARAKSAPAALAGARRGAPQQKSASAQSRLPYDVRSMPVTAASKRVSQVPLKTSGPAGAHLLRILPQPKAPRVVLYDQYDNAGANATLSATFTDFPTFSSDLADDFVVPSGETWNVESIDADGIYFNGPGPATDWNVFIYTDNAGVPGTQIYSTLNQPVTVNGTTFTVNLTPAAVLTEGTYWIEIQANMTFGTQGEWGWTDRTVQANAGAEFRNPGGDLGCGTDWILKTLCVPTLDPDQVYRINGTTGGGTGNCGDYTFALDTATFVPGVDALNLDCDDCGTDVALPFTVHLYDQDFTTVHVGSNGHATFGTFDDGFGITCSPFGIAGTTYALAPFWDDQTIFAADGHDIFTTTTGVSPDRIFYIEWRSFYFGEADPLDYEIALFENGSPPFQYIYNTITPSSVPNPFSQLVIGVKKDDSNFNQYGCDPSGGQAPPVSSGQALTATCVVGPPPSPTPTPSGTPSGCTVTGVIDGSDPTETDRMFRDGVASTCALPKVCPGVLGDGLPRHYDSYTFTNTTGSTQCVTIDADAMTCTGTNFIFLQAYLGSFDPSNLCTNYLADIGGSPNPTGSFSFDLADGQTVVIVVNEVDPDAGCVGYSFTVSGICGGGVSPTPSPTCPPGNPTGAAGPWTAGNPYPTTIVRYGFAQTATHFYVFGGVDNGAITNAVNRMDLSTGVWEPRAAMPTIGGEAPTCALDATAGVVYCTDGTNGSGFFSYDIATDTWNTLASIPESDTYGSASGAFNGKVFVAGGTGGITNAVWVYDIGLNSWSPGTAAPALFLLAGYQQVGQFLYVVGGFDPTFVNNATTWRLDMSSAPGVWDVGPAFTPQRADFGLAYDAGTNKLYALAGDLPNDGNPFNSTNLVDELDLSGWPGGTWNPSPPDMPPQNRQANQAGFYGNGEIWSVGGINGATFQFFNEVWHRNNGGGVVCPSPTPTLTPTPTSTVPPVSPTPTATATIPPVTPTPTATATATETPRPTPTPRPRPTPHPRP
jgi:hypothetical protein